MLVLYTLYSVIGLVWIFPHCILVRPIKSGLVGDQISNYTEYNQEIIKNRIIRENMLFTFGVSCAIWLWHQWTHINNMITRFCWALHSMRNCNTWTNYAKENRFQERKMIIGVWQVCERHVYYATETIYDCIDSWAEIMLIY